MVEFDETIKTSKKKKTKEIKVGEEEVTNGVGRTSTKDIVETLEGVKTTKDISYEATQRLTIRVIKNTSRCFLSSRTEELVVTETCTETEYTGDEDVFTTTFEKSCNGNNVASDLKRKLGSELSRNLFID